MCVQFWPDQKTGTVNCKPVKVNYSDTVPMEDCDKVLLDVLDSGKVCLTIIVPTFNTANLTRPNLCASHVVKMCAS